MFKTIFDNVLSTTGTSRKSSYFGLAFLLLSLFPLTFLFHTWFFSWFEIAVTINQEGYLFGSFALLVSVIIFIFSLLQVPSVYYFSKDTEFYLSLPLKPSEILGGRFLTSVIYEYLLIIIVYLPLLFSYLAFDFSIVKLLFGVIVGLVLPFIPVLLASLIIIFLMNFVPLFKNKNALNLIIGMFTIVFAIGIQFSIGSQASVENYQKLQDMLIYGNDSLLNNFFKIYPFVIWAANAITKSSILDLLLYLGFTLLLIMLYFIFTQRFYLNGVTNISEGSRSRKRFDKENVQTYRQESTTLLFFKRELKLLFRTPTYLLNLVLGTLIGPILVLVYTFIAGGESALNVEQFNEFSAIINNFLASPINVVATVVVGGFVFGLVLSMLNMISITAISREGQGLYNLKSLPIRFWEVLLGKILVGVSLSMFGALLLVIPIILYVNINPLILIGVIVYSFLVVFGYNALGIYIDVKKPKLNWTNEIQAAKQNLNAGMMVLVCAMGLGLYGALVFAAISVDLIIIPILISIVVTGLMIFLPVKTLIVKADLFFSKINQG
ncbi:MAG: ABC transporter permease [Erysipelothrix sp.]|nr:ABC transporter permease [Erysipelothrix sp.]